MLEVATPMISTSDEQPGTPRLFFLSDAMMLIAAAAIALAVGRGYFNHYRQIRGGSIVDMRSQVIFTCSFIALAWTLALIPLGSIGFLSSSRVFRPGMAMCLAVALNVAFMTYYHAWGLIQSQGRQDLKTEFWNLTAQSVLPYQNAMVIAVAWAILWRSGSWRPEPTWIDRLGRFLGICWIGSAVLLKAVLTLWG
jgi:hypothetical protein